jgi:hypothetical protein
MSIPGKDKDRGPPALNIFRNGQAGWYFRTLCAHLGMDHKAVSRQLRLKGLALETRRGHVLSERDIETIIGAVEARRNERLSGSRRIRER